MWSWGADVAGDGFDDLEGVGGRGKRKCFWKDERGWSLELELELEFNVFFFRRDLFWYSAWVGR